MSGRHTILDVTDLQVAHTDGRQIPIHAVSGVSLRVAAGETLGLVGESGCGKTSLARAIIQLPPPVAGSVVFCGEDLMRMCRNRLQQIRPSIQMVFQDSAAALNPRRPVGHSIAMPLHIRRMGPRRQRRQRAREMMTQVGLDPATDGRRPFEFSGGQCQRIQIARALITEPRLLICDEPVSALDVSIQAQIIHLLVEMKRRYALAMLFISHDMAVVKTVSKRVAVMYLGRLCETAPVADLFGTPLHPYTAALISAVPGGSGAGPALDVRLTNAEPPSAQSPPTGCRFHPRCPRAQGVCAQRVPELQELVPDRTVACHFPLWRPRKYTG